MELTDEQLRIAVDAVSLARDSNFTTAPKAYQAQLRLDTASWILPVLRKLPEGVTPNQLLHHDLLLQQVAIELLVSKLRRVQIYAGAEEAELLVLLTQEHIFQATRQLYLFTVAALEALAGLQNELAEVLEHFDELDLDAELARLTEE